MAIGYWQQRSKGGFKDEAVRHGDEQAVCQHVWVTLAEPVQDIDYGPMWTAPGAWVMEPGGPIRLNAAAVFCARPDCSAKPDEA